MCRNTTMNRLVDAGNKRIMTIDIVKSKVMRIEEESLQIKQQKMSITLSV